MRERELKLSNCSPLKVATMSLPMRERELKRDRGGDLVINDRSLPMRERELKLAEGGSEKDAAVAPHAGARIET